MLLGGAVDLDKARHLAMRVGGGDTERAQQRPRQVRSHDRQHALLRWHEHQQRTHAEPLREHMPVLRRGAARGGASEEAGKGASEGASEEAGEGGHRSEAGPCCVEGTRARAWSGHGPAQSPLSGHQSAAGGRPALGRPKGLRVQRTRTRTRGGGGGGTAARTAGRRRRCSRRVPCLAGRRSARPASSAAAGPPARPRGAPTPSRSCGRQSRTAPPRRPCRRRRRRCRRRPAPPPGPSPSCHSQTAAPRPWSQRRQPGWTLPATEAARPRRPSPSTTTLTHRLSGSVLCTTSLPLSCPCLALALPLSLSLPLPFSLPLSLSLPLPLSLSLPLPLPSSCLCLCLLSVDRVQKGNEGEDLRTSKKKVGLESAGDAVTGSRRHRRRRRWPGPTAWRTRVQRRPGVAAAAAVMATAPRRGSSRRCRRSHRYWTCRRPSRRHAPSRARTARRCGHQRQPRPS